MYRRGNTTPARPRDTSSQVTPALTQLASAKPFRPTGKFGERTGNFLARTGSLSGRGQRAASSPLQWSLSRGRCRSQPEQIISQRVPSARPDQLADHSFAAAYIQKLSLGLAILLIVAYGLGLLFSRAHTANYLRGRNTTVARRHGPWAWHWARWRALRFSSRWSAKFSSSWSSRPLTRSG